MQKNTKAQPATRRGMLWALAMLCALGFGFSFGGAAWAKPFTLPVLPDTQIAVNRRPDMLQSQVEWLAKTARR
jgi:hypothetical protein